MCKGKTLELWLILNSFDLLFFGIFNSKLFLKFTEIINKSNTLSLFEIHFFLKK